MLLFSCEGTFSDANKADEELVDLVNPYMGNISHLLVPTFPTVHLPNSMMRMTPARGDFTEVTLAGLPLLLTSHRGSKAFSISPFQGEERELSPILNYSYDQENLTPYSYSVFLDEQQIQVEFGLSHQSAAYTLSFEQDGNAGLLINSASGEMHWDGASISGYQDLQNNTRVYLYMVANILPDKRLGQ